MTRYIFAAINNLIDGVDYMYVRVPDIGRRHLGKLVFVAVALGVLLGLTNCSASIAVAAGTVSPVQSAPAAGALRPFVSTYPVSLAEDPRDPYQKMYFSRPRPVTLAATLHNPTGHDAVATVFCPGDIFEGHSTRNVFVKAGGERRFLVEVMSPRMHDGCTVDFFHFVGLPGPDPDL